MTAKERRPYRGMRGDYVLEQDYRGDWIVVVGGTMAACEREARAYRNGLSIGYGLRITSNAPGAPVRAGSLATVSFARARTAAC